MQDALLSTAHLRARSRMQHAKLSTAQLLASHTYAQRPSVLGSSWYAHITTHDIHTNYPLPRLYHPTRQQYRTPRSMLQHSFLFSSFFSHSRTWSTWGRRGAGPGPARRTFPPAPARHSVVFFQTQTLDPGP
eukprot:535447-Rhodomonas_salina.2